MNHGLSDQVRTVALDKFVMPAVRAGKVRFLCGGAGFDAASAGRWFSREEIGRRFAPPSRRGSSCGRTGWEIEGVDGPPKKQSPTVVVRYRVAGRGKAAVAEPRN